MALSANKIKMCRQKIFIPARHFTLGAAGVDIGTIDPGVTFLEVGTSGATALEMIEGEEIKGIVAIPSKCDRNNKIRFKVIFSSASTTDADDFVFTLTAVGVAPNGVDVITATPAALDTPIPATVKGAGAGNSIQAAGPGIMNGGTLADDDEFLILNLDATTADATVDLYGIQMEYTPKFYKGHIVEAPAWQNDN